ncbi:hypothetical protein OBP_237 [Pseudomonas phage OBP]|uniref:hypothetical protein n=1 Tax=Pseudomonas phage OBP TaxID=1124849 RepID=UPI000240D5D1|nr:hypothetical protein OBP_237 [Pseudomonas phage OBP]AEV89674.1 hypothetical protein OBP_237 [Pseudomonas phage OBP]
MANNFAFVNHYETRNAAGVAFIKSRLVALINFSSEEKEDEIGSVTMNAIRTIARVAFGRIPFGRTEFKSNSVETFQNWYNDFAETNNLKSIKVTGVWNEETQIAFASIADKYEGTL